MKVKLRESYNGSIINSIIEVKPAEGRRLIAEHKAVKVAPVRAREPEPVEQETAE